MIYKQLIGAHSSVEFKLLRYLVIHISTKLKDRHEISLGALMLLTIQMSF